MRAAWYEHQGPAGDVLEVGELPTPAPGAGEVRLKVAVSGINPGDLKKREDFFGYGMAYPLVIPHSDGAGVIDQLGEGVDEEWLGRRVWCYGAQSYRPFGTAAEYTVLPLKQVAPLPDGVSSQQGACLGIPAITAHRAVHIAGPVAGRTVLVQGGAGAVGLSAVALAHYAGARVVATVRRAVDEPLVRASGADEVVVTTGGNVAEAVRVLAPGGVDHIVEVAFAANLVVNTEVLALGGSIAACATDDPTPALPFWELLFKNARIFLVGSDDLPLEAKRAAVLDVNAALKAGWKGYEITSLPLAEIARAHELVDRPTKRGRVVLTL